MSKKAIVIDGNSLIYRLYFASTAMKLKAPNIDVKRQTIKMTYSICFSLVWNKDWDFKIVAFDSKAKLIRKQQLEAYKENRKPMPDDLVNILPNLKDIFAKFGFVLLAKDGYEADDLVGSFVTLANRNDVFCEIYTSDRDLLQLINSNSTVNLLKKGISDVKQYNLEEFIKDYEFKPDLIPDYKAIAGDSSDNFHGIAGIGPKTARELLIKFPNGIDEIYEHIADIKQNSLQQKLINGKEECYLCKKIATIDTTLFLEQDLNYLKALPIKEMDIENDIHALNFDLFNKYFKSPNK